MNRYFKESKKGWFVAFILANLHCACALVQLDIWRDSTAQSLTKRSLARGELTLENTVSFYQTKLLIGNPPQDILVQVDTGSSDLWVISADNPYCAIGSLKCSIQSAFVGTNSHSLSVNETSEFSISYSDSTFASGVYVQDDVQIGGVEFKEHDKHRSTNRKTFGHSSNGYWVRSSDEYGNDEGDDEEYDEEETRNDSDTDSTVGPSPFVIYNANFALATRSNSTVAVWGIGMDSTEAMARHIDEEGNMYPTYPNLPMQMKEQGYIKTVAYSLWLNDLNSASGSLLFGGVDHAKYQGELKTVPMVSNYKNISKPLDFSVMLHGIRGYNSQNQIADIVDCSISVVLDSGTTYTQLPRQLLQPIADALGAFYDSKDGVFLVNETQAATLSGTGLQFNLSGININVNMDELLIPIGNLKRFHPRQAPEISMDDIQNGYHMPDGDGDDDYYDYDYDDSDSSPYSDPLSIKARKRPMNYYLLGLYPIESSMSSEYILGDTFLRSAYVVYDLERKEIALANTNYNATDTSVEPIGEDGIPSAKNADMYSSTTVADVMVKYNAGYIFAASATTAKADGSSASPVTVTTAFPSYSSPATETFEANYDSNTAIATSGACCKHPSSTHLMASRHRNGASSVKFQTSQLIWGVLISASLYLL